MMKKWVLFISYFLGVVATLCGQSEESLEYYQDKYPNSDQVFLVKSNSWDISVQGDSLLIRSKVREETIYLKESGLGAINESIYNSSFVKTSNVEAFTKVPNRKKFNRVPVQEYFSNSDIDGSIFYDDSQMTSFVFPGVVIGARAVLKYDKELTDPHFFGSFFFGSWIPLEKAVFEVTADESVALVFNEYNLEGLGLEKSTKRANGRVTYRFELNDVDQIKLYRMNQSFSHVAPNIKARIAHFTDSKGERHQVLETVKDLYHWYSTFIGDKKWSKSNEVQKIVDEVTAGLSNDLDKVKAIFYWVQDNIKYIAFEDGMRGFVPHDGAYVCEKRYGDCKDMASIIVNMLHHAGIDGHYTWIGTRKIPYTYHDLPTPSVDNHMIATYIDPESDKIYYLDATGQHMAFGQPTSMIQGKQALIAIDEETYRIETVPVSESIDNLMSDSSTLVLKNGGIEGEGVATIFGYAKVNNTFKMVNTDERDTEKYIWRLMARGNNKCFIDKYSIANLEDRNTPIRLNYSFRVKEYYKEINGDIYVNLNLDKGLSGYSVDDEVKYAKTNEYKYINNSVTKLMIPDGYKVKRLPDNSSLSNDVYAYKVTYETKDNYILLNRTFELKYLVLEPEQFEDWNSALGSFEKEMRRIIILTAKD